METAFLNAEYLFRVAREAYGRIDQRTDDRAPDQNDALVSILFAAATLEALILELAHLARGGGVLRQNPHATAFALTIDELEEGRASTRAKFLLGMLALCGETYDKGAQPFQDFDLLFRLRDSIVHLKPEKLEADAAALLKRLQPKHVVSDELQGRSSWVRRISTRAAARWACNVVVEMVESLREAIGRNPGSLLDEEFWGNDYLRVQ